MGLINDILDFSKIEAGKLDLETVDFDLHDLLDSLAASLATQAQGKGIELVRLPIRRFLRLFAAIRAVCARSYQPRRQRHQVH